MLELVNVCKEYPTGAESVQALKGVSLQLRNNEFVSILGPSGCGKTTLLNILGGLDRYTTGDLRIRGVSTEKYKARDWDTYRNHSVGFVFQSYNLIPHQTVLANVELALTLSGVSRRERRRRAVAALEEVGLGDQLKKRPAQMSGGQMQRVAIARAVVNDPDVILADEPTGALDTETSVQVMELLKKLSEKRLVVMVTHNPDLAETYSTRIVRMLDGRIVGDSRPLTQEEATRETEADDAFRAEAGRQRKPTMGAGTSFGLSLRNLITKKGRTALTSFAGSIGIIGIALIYAVSQGTTNYINAVQEETLQSYPITIEATTVTLSSLLEAFMGEAESLEEHGEGRVYEKAMVYKLVKAVNSLEEQENDLTAFQSWLDGELAAEESKMADALSAVQYTYNMDLSVYTRGVDDQIIRSDTETLLTSLMGQVMGSNMPMMSMRGSSAFSGGFSASSSGLWKELLTGKDGAAVNEVTKGQYELLYGRWPENYDEIVLFVDGKGELTELTLYALGLRSEEDIRSLMEAAVNRTDPVYEGGSWSYEELCGMDFRVILPCDAFAKDEETGVWTDLRESDTGLKYLYDNALKLRVTGIVRPGDGAVNSSESGSVGYTHRLTEYVLRKAEDAPAVLAQKETPELDVLTGLPFRPEETGSAAEQAEAFLTWEKLLSAGEKAELYVKLASEAPQDVVTAGVAQAMAGLTRQEMEAVLLQAVSAEAGMDADSAAAYLGGLSDEEVAGYYAQAVEAQVRQEYAAGVAAQLLSLGEEEKLALLDALLAESDEETMAGWYDAYADFSDSDYDANLLRLGCLRLDEPAAVNLYAVTFEDKDVIEACIAEYNNSVPELQQLQYTDYVGLLMNSVTTIINAITYVLIAFVAVSLVVSSIMIGVITLISVQERTKEIGILRSLGASKRDVSGMFNAETVLIGFGAGLLGVGITWLLCIPINAILHALTDISTLSAVLPVSVAAILVAISVFLTLLAGIIPSRGAAKKDPVVALRTE